MESESSGHLLSLPSLVINEVLHYLEFEDLTNLRATCKSTKSWVEQPPYLAKFVLNVTDDKRLAQISQPTTTPAVLPWVHINFTQIKYRDNGSAKLLQHVRQSLQTLTIGPIGDSRNEYFGTLNLIQQYLEHLGPNLESLRLIGQFMLCPPSTSTSEPRSREDPMPISRRKLKTLSFPNLKDLSVVLRTPCDANLTWPFIVAMLECCPNLTKMEFPTLTLARSCARLPPQSNPFIPYLTKLGQKPRHERPTKFLLDLCTIRDLIERDERKCLEDLTSIFELNMNILLQLAALCFPIHGKLLNVPISALPTHDQAKNLPTAQLVNLNKSVGSILCKNRTTGVANIFIPSAASMIVSIGIEYRDQRPYDEFELPQDTNVTNISFGSHYEWNEIRGASAFFIVLMQTVRPTVTSFKFRHNLPFPPGPSGTPYNLSTHFPNLRKLALVEVRDLFNCYLVNMFRDLPQRLEELDFEDCEFTEECFFAEGPRTRHTRPLICNMPNLKYLRLWSCLIKTEDGDESGVDFEAIFKEMDLTKFVFKKYIRPCHEAHAECCG